MKGLFFLFVSVFLSAAPTVQEVHELKVVVRNIEKQRGKVRICLTNKKSDFLKDCYLSADVKANGKEVTGLFAHVPPGKYAVAVYHDEDDNGELNTGGLFGIPTEDYGFSNNPAAYFGPPSYEKCTFDVRSDTTITIKL